MARSTRRDFLKFSMGAGALAGFTVPGASAQTVQRSAADWVTLGRSNVQVTRLAFGTGTHGGVVQRRLGQENFTRLVRYAYDRGIRFFETAESYDGMPEMLATALKGLPRESYKLMTKCTTPVDGDPKTKIDEFRRQLNTEYIDIVLLHCLRPVTWSADYAALQHAFSAAKDKQAILAHGASVHGLPALRTFPGNRWLDVALIRINHKGTRMDVNSDHEPPSEAIGNVAEVVRHAKQVHQQGMGVIGMKLCGEGRFTRPEDRDAAMSFVMNLGAVDAVTIGFKNTREIDDAIERMNRVLNA